MEQLLQRALELSQKTGERLIVCDQKTGAAFVILSLEAYEAFVNKADFQQKKHTISTKKEPEVARLTNTSLLDKINRELGEAVETPTPEASEFLTESLDI